MIEHPANPTRNRGFSILEMAFFIAIAGLLISASLGRAQLPSYPRDGDTTQALAALQQQVTDAVIEYARRYHRLPCADTDGITAEDEGAADGIEGTQKDGCGAASESRFGYVPFATLGLQTPNSQQADYYRRLRYAVYRSDQADLVRPWHTLSGKAAPAPGPQRARNLLLYTLRIASTQPLDPTNAYLTGDDGALGTIDCASNPVTNVAFLILSTGARDADRQDLSPDIALFDGPHQHLSAEVRCFAAPSTPTTEHYDDTVTAIGFNRLAGELLTVGRR
ncbi:type II secretion system protein [Marichromatium bheemlicum]|uniref:Prepilin-type N-terminal cleavage/methylation domain-containing protein n=1 Tax=Marichromatium bheemlicum TaxID=365339 RepID=A0ABX1I841_9GAMM|nr:hypothetical protein [Marichromatium bheemlicum]NKN32385.1 hypothetical protein [Marichromatium bheemlicum]